MNRVAKLASIFIVVLLASSFLHAGRKEFPVDKLTPKMVKKIRKINILFFNEPVTKKLTIKFTPNNLYIYIKYYQPKSVINKIIRLIADIDKNKKINGFESDAIYTYFHKTMIKNLTFQINDNDINCKTVSSNIPDVYGPVDNRPFIYEEELKCDLKGLVKRKHENVIFINDFITLTKGQERFESPVEVKVIMPGKWKVENKKIKKSKNHIIINNIKVDRQSSARIIFIPR